MLEVANIADNDSIIIPCNTMPGTLHKLAFASYKKDCSGKK